MASWPASLAGPRRRVKVRPLQCGGAFKGGRFVCDQRRTSILGGGEMKKKGGELSFLRGMKEDGDIAVGMQAACDDGAAGAFDPQAL